MYLDGYCSDHDISEKDIDIIIEHECKCDDCNKSIFDLDDFPEIGIEIDYLLCEDCYNYRYQEYCPICCEYHYSNEINEDELSSIYYIGIENKSGVYKAIDYPIYSAATGGLGTTHIFWDNLEFVCDIETFIEANNSEEVMEQWKEFQEDNSLEFAEMLCPYCKISKE